MAADWEEIRRLAADFQRAQFSETVQRLSERNCIEIITKLVQEKKLDVVHTLDGKEYITPAQISREIRDELYVHGGRINIVDLQQILNVDWVHVENRASDIAKSDKGVQLVLGQLIDDSYLDRLAEEVNDKLQEAGTISVAELCKSYDLPGDFLTEELSRRLGKLIQGQMDQYNRGVIFTPAFVARHRARIRGLFSAITRPTPVSSMIGTFGFQEHLLYSVLEEMVNCGRLKGSVVGGRQDKAVYIPDIYARTQNTWVDSFLQHGQVRALPDSWAALSTCHGLHGMFSDGNFSYGIEPVGSGEVQNDHVVYRMSNIDLSPPPCPGCSVSGLEPEAEADSHGDGDGALKDGDGLSQGGMHFFRSLRRSKRQVRRGQRTVQTETKYIELMVVNDYELFVQLRRSTTQTKNFAKSVVNTADFIYKEQLNTRIVLVAMETWSSENKVSISDDALLTLRDFMKYRKESIKQRCDAVHLFSGRTFMSSRSEAAYIGGICSLTRGGGINEFGSVGPMAITLSQSLGQNIGMLRNKERTAAGDCRCPDPWLGCIMEDTGYYLPRKFSRCSIDEYLRFLQQGGGSCLFNKPTKLLDPSECGNGFVEPGEECDCGSLVECAQNGANCCKKCTLTHNAMCSNGLCCRDCKYELRGVKCRDAVNDCDIAETCTGDSSQCPHNVHKLDGYICEAGQGRCYGGRCKTRDGQCRTLWGYNSADRFCYEKLNSEGTEKGNCGPDPRSQGWLPCNKQDVLCGLLLCTNLTERPRFGELQGKLTSLTIHHQNRYLDCRGGHAVLDDGLDLGYVEDGTPCGPNMMCLERRCLPVVTFNLSTCPGSSSSRICSHHGTCSNEVKCICDPDFTGKDCSVFDPIPTPTAPDGPEKHRGPSGTNIIIGSVAGAILLAAIILGGTGWGFKNIRKGRYDPAFPS